MANTNAAVAQIAAPQDAKKKERSPSYPGINLETALARATEFNTKEKQNQASVPVVAADWGMTVKSSTTLVTIAALKAYGLISDSGVGDKRRLQISDLGRRIVLDTRPDSQERAAAIKTAALNPTMHRTLWAKWGNSLPSDANMRHSLIFDHKFNSNTVGDFIRLYKDTIRFAKLDESDKVALEDGDRTDTGTGDPYVPKVGDYVQWEPKGILQFMEPRRVREICSDGKHALVDGSYAGLPIAELTLQKAPVIAPNKPESHVPSSPTKGMQEFVVPLSAGSRAVFQWPTTLSKEDIDDLKDSLKILERKITRSSAKPQEEIGS
jgi:hypothetical protein